MAEACVCVFKCMPQFARTVLCEAARSEVSRSQQMAHGRAPRSAVVYVTGVTASSIYEIKYAPHQLGGSKDGDEGED